MAEPDLKDAIAIATTSILTALVREIAEIKGQTPEKKHAWYDHFESRCDKLIAITQTELNNPEAAQTIADAREVTADLFHRAKEH